MTDEETSDFGKGFTYCIGLFLAHAERATHYRELEEKVGGMHARWPEMWFNGAADHLFELEIPKRSKMKEVITEWQGKCLAWRLSINKPGPTWEDVRWAIQTAKDILRLWDTECKIQTIKGRWE